MHSLKSLYAKHFQIGVAVPPLPGNHAPAELDLITAQFNNITPENHMKPQPIHPAEDRWDFTAADGIVSFANLQNIDVTGHTLVWHQQCPDWMFTDGSGPASRQLVLSRLQKHIETLLGHYRGRLQGIDVVNEAIDDALPYLRQSKWIATVGDDFVVQAFRFAQAADPNLRLYYNDYNDELPAKRSKTLRLLRELFDAGCKVDAVGIQGHWELDKIPFTEIETAIQQFAELGLDVMITELDIDVVDRSGTADPFTAGMSPEVAQRQADQYAQLFRLFKKHSDKITRVAFWGLQDGRSWLNGWPRKRTNHALLFDRNCSPKLAFDAVAQVALT